ncbi:MAG: hypothetical protein ACOH18_02035 [Candidatus Saccharimonadaceae bacterium]
MYAGTTFSHQSGNVVGAHQRIDRVAKKHLIHVVGRGSFFPSIKTILHFEGKNGPDGIKSKSPAVDEPWHFINPEAGVDDPLVSTIKDHMYNLSVALKAEDEVRAGFEAAWLSHAVVDGLTPPHHYPFAEKIEELFGKPHYERLTTKEKNIIVGRNTRDTLSKNWQYWGKGGVFTAHFGYEWGFSSAIAIGSFKDIGITSEDLRRVEREGYIPFFLESVKTVDGWGTYQEYLKTDWSAYLGRVARKQLAPLIMKNVVLAWYAATKGITS